MVRFCERCGGQLEEKADFCNYFGEDLKERKLMQKNQPSITPHVQQESAITTQEVEIYDYAFFMKRLVACLIDLSISGIICVFYLLFVNIIRYSLRLSPSKLERTRSIALIGVPLITLFYFWLLESFNKGQTIGKMALKIRTVNKNTLEPTKPIYYTINNLLKCIPILFVLDIIISLFADKKDSKGRLRIMQKASKTIVIKTKYTIYTKQLYERSRSIPPEIKKQVWEHDKGVCVYCGSNTDIEFDHIIPFSKGSSNTVNNIQILCEKYNKAKYNKINR